MRRQESELRDDLASTSPVRLPDEPITRVVEPVTRFLHVESVSGVVLLVCTVAALILANSAVSEQFVSLWRTPIGFSLGVFEVRHSLRHWINDGLMVLFFFVVGLEVKRELVLVSLLEIR
jgi:NhaA family Na+:H+ antiporter